MSTHFDDQKNATVVDIEDDTGYIGQYKFATMNGKEVSNFYPDKSVFRHYLEQKGE